MNFLFWLASLRTLSLIFGSAKAIEGNGKITIRLNPFGPAWYFFSLGNALWNSGQFEEAASAYKKSVQHAPDNLFAHLGLTHTYSAMGREKEARAEAAEVLRINPNFSVDTFVNTLPYRDRKRN